MGALTEADPRPGGRDDRLLAWPAVRDITGLSRTTAWRMQKTGDFPLPVLVSPGRVGWWESELAAWKMTRAPRRPAETRSFGATAGRPARAPAEAGQLFEAEAGERDIETGAPRPAAQRRGRRREAETSPGQIAFDFGS
ncbi:MAG: AlpA family phage regulatory protein [Brevundimonas sp.]|uniref:helix-turn-helix transcriptional regulator n=1 Tax=Brevundimonas sp. TaxID=1871086 RepID=UPI00271E38D1|nr:AlpA family phage regulatory protein [Brevundimonas sp.]MDO9589038.1 AlpA family phage regulatory protein [Brevundimonas sp.]